MESEEEDWEQPMNTSGSDTCLAAMSPPSVPRSYKSSSPQSLHSRVIVHIDIDCFYAQVEMLRNPALSEKPLGIQQKYIMVTCNYVARARGLTKLMTVKDAKAKCPELMLVCGEDLTHYRNMSYKISRYLQSICPLVERLGFDENFLDITNLVKDRMQQNDAVSLKNVSGHLFADPAVSDACECGYTQRLVVGSQIASEIRAGLLSELGITSSAGIAHNKLLSKLVAGCFKPNQQTTLLPCHASLLLSQLDSLRQIPGIGHATAKKLQELGILTVADMLEADSHVLENAVGNVTIETMKNLCKGIDNSPVVLFGPPQTLSDEDSFKKCSTLAEAQVKIAQLLDSLFTRLLEDGRVPQTLRLSIRRMSETNRYGNRESRQCAIPGSVFNRFSTETLPQVASRLETLAFSLCTKMLNPAKPFHITLINVAFTKLESRSNKDIGSFFENHQLLDGRKLDGHNSTDFDDDSLDVRHIVVENRVPASGNFVTIGDSVNLQPESNVHVCATKLVQDSKETLHTVVNKGKQPVNRKSMLFTWLSSPEKSAEKLSSSDETERSSGSSNSKYVKLNYEDIDREVLAGLPMDIQKEIAEYSMHGRGACNKELHVTESKPSVVVRQPSSMTHTGSKDYLTDEQHSDELVYIPADVDRSVFAALPPEIQKEMSEDWKRRGLTVSTNSADRCVQSENGDPKYKENNSSYSKPRSKLENYSTSNIACFFKKQV